MTGFHAIPSPTSRSTPSETSSQPHPKRNGSVKKSEPNSISASGLAAADEQQSAGQDPIPSDTVKLVDAPHEDQGVVELEPIDPKTVFLAGLFIITVGAVLYVAKAVILPMVLAFVLKLLFQPVIRQADKIRLPRVVSALLITISLLGALTALAAALSGSTSAWLSQLPQGASRFEQKFSFLHAPAELLHQLDGTIDRFLGGTGVTSLTASSGSRPSLPEALLSGTGTMLDVSFSSLLLLFFLLATGDTFLRRLVEVLPRFHDKRQAVDISMQIERDIGRYLLTVTFMNLLVGAATTLGMSLSGLHDPILWGVIAFILNYVPILGPMAGFVLFGLVGFLSFDSLGAACLPAIIYIGIHIAEGEILTPMLLASRLTLNPAVIVMSLITWYWLWGVAGAFLAVPLLAITKIICARFRPLMAFGHFLGD